MSGFTRPTAQTQGTSSQNFDTITGLHVGNWSSLSDFVLCHHARNKLRRVHRKRWKREITATLHAAPVQYYARLASRRARTGDRPLPIVFQLGAKYLRSRVSHNEKNTVRYKNKCKRLYADQHTILLFLNHFPATPPTHVIFDLAQLLH